MDIVRSAPPREELAMFLDRCAIRPITPRFVASGRLRMSVGLFRSAETNDLVDGGHRVSVLGLQTTLRACSTRYLAEEGVEELDNRLLINRSGLGFEAASRSPRRALLANRGFPLSLEGEGGRDARGEGPRTCLSFDTRGTRDRATRPYRPPAER